MQIETRSFPLAVTNPVSGNITAASITFPLPTVTVPSGDGVINLGHGGGSMCPNSIMLIPFGAGSSTNTFSMNVYAWNPVPGQAGSAGGALGLQDIWVAAVLATFTCTLCTVPGLVNTPVNGSQLFCGTIALVAGNANVSNEVVSPTGNVVAHVIVDVKGARMVEVRFGTGSSATSCNSLYKTV